MTDLGLWETHKTRCDAVQRRGVQLRLKAAIANLAIFGDAELESLNVCRRDLEKVEAEMTAAGQAP